MKVTLKLNEAKLRKIPSKIRQVITKEMRSPEVRKELGEIVGESIKDDPQGIPAPSTLKWRERYDPINNTDKKYLRTRINFAFTGELIADLKKNVRLSIERSIISFVFANSDKRHKKYQGVTKKIGSNSKYSEIEQGLRDMGYDYPRINEESKQKSTEYLRDKIRKVLKNLFKVG
jgi:hypothetical protein